MEAVEKQKGIVTEKKEGTKYQKDMQEQYWYFFGICVCFGICYVFGNYKNGAGFGRLLALVGEIGCCFAAWKQWKIAIKRDSIFYIGMIVVLGVLMLWTEQGFLHFLQKKAILLLFLLMMLHQFYEERQWNFATYVRNLLGVFVSGMVSFFQPIEGFLEQCSKKEKFAGKMAYVFLGMGIALPLGFISMLLLASADEIFENMLFGILKSFLLPQNVLFCFFLFLLSFWCFYCFLGGMARQDSKEVTEGEKKGEPIIAMTFTSVLLLLYVVFCGIQIVYLFLGKEGGLPEGYTYAMYARKGFFELLFVSVLNFMVLTICNTYFREHKGLRGILLGISICTMILIASSAYRMVLYIQAYHLTRLRVFVLWSLAYLAVAMVGTVYSMYRKKWRLFSFLLWSGFCFLVLLSSSRPDALIAKYNLAQSNVYTERDITYLMGLSLDVVPELAKVKPEQIIMAVEGYTSEEMMKVYFREVKEVCEERNWRTSNFSVAKAKESAMVFLER